MLKNRLKKLGVSFIATALLITTPHTTINAATYSHFGEGFDFFNWGNWEKSDNWSNGDMFNCSWKGYNAYTTNGTLNLSLTQDYSCRNGYAGAEIRSRAKYGYGLYQVRMKPAKNVGIVSSFFTYTGPNDQTPWDEIDIEFLGKNTTQVQFNYYTNGVGHHEYAFSIFLLIIPEILSKVFILLTYQLRLFVLFPLHPDM